MPVDSRPGASLIAFFAMNEIPRGSPNNQSVNRKNQAYPLADICKIAVSTSFTAIIHIFRTAPSSFP
jgi:hypothetical protein